MPHQQYICEHCKTKFGYTPYAMERGNKSFCRRQCWEEWRVDNKSIVPPYLQLNGAKSEEREVSNKVRRSSDIH